LQIRLGEDFGTRFNDLEGLNYNLSYNNQTSNFKLDYNFDRGYNEACLRVDRVQDLGGREKVSESCSQSSSGTILVKQPRVNETVFEGVFEAERSSDGVFEELDTLRKSWISVSDFTTTTFALFLQLLLTLAFIGITIQSIPLMITAVPLSLFIGSTVGLLAIPTTVTLGMVIIGLIISYTVSRVSR